MSYNDEVQSVAATQAPPPPSESNPKKAPKKTPQNSLNNFWDAFTTKFPGKVDTVLPKNVYAKSKAAHEPKGTVHGQAAIKSYEEARTECVIAVEKIAKECKRVNMRYRDPHFDIEFDLKRGKKDCLMGLNGTDEGFSPNSVKRIHEIFEDPQFFLEGASASDVRQGNDGDCWFMAALCALGNKRGLIDKVCVAKDEKVGVYGFVFHRDGEWIQTIIDDKLYLSATDYDESTDEKTSWNKVFNRQDAEEEYRKAYQTNSRALYFAQCSSENETWLPLLEKAFAKAHGDYQAISGGFTGEAIEDLTGGVTTELFTTDVLDTDQFWKEEIMKVNQDFLFGCATGVFDDWKNEGNTTDRKGIVAMHAYSIMEAREVRGERLLRVRNPWGKFEWQGAWSDGSEQWTPEWMQLLDHRFGNDGMFWISYKDLLRKFQSFDRTRLFGPEWTVTQRWTTLDVPWSADYNDTKFSVTLTKKSSVVIVLSQLDDRYFRGLEGQYYFSLHFRLAKDGEDGYIVRSHGNYLMSRSVSTDLELEPGTYSVLMKITATRYQSDKTPEDIVRENCKSRQEKLLQIGLAYDLAHAKGRYIETEEEKKEKKRREERKKATTKKKQREAFLKQKKKDWDLRSKQKARDKRHQERLEKHRQKKAEERKATAANEEPAKSETTGESGDPNVVEKQETAASDAQVKIVDNKEAEIPLKVDQQAPAPTEPLTEQPTTAGAVERKTEDSTTATSNIPSPPASTNSTAEIQTPADSTPTASQAEGPTSVEDATPSVLVNGSAADPALAPPPPPPSTHHCDPADDDNSDADTLLSFSPSVDSDLDEFPPASSLDAPEDEEDQQSAASDDDVNAEFANDPWNAICVVGLRVYSKDKGVSIDVVRPKNVDEGEADLDLDDPSKGASVGVDEGVVEEVKREEKRKEEEAT